MRQEPRGAIASDGEPISRTVRVGKGSAVPASLAACTGSNGETVHVIGRGTDRAMWRNVGNSRGSSWKAHWEAIPGGTFTSAPALVCKENASVLHAYGFGTDFRVWGTRSTAGGLSWENWAKKGNQVYL